MCYQNSPVHTEMFSGYRVEIWPDYDCMDPVTNWGLPGEYYKFDYGTYSSLEHSNTKNKFGKLELAYHIKSERYPLVIAFTVGRYQHMSARRINFWDAPESVICDKVVGFYIMDRKTIISEWGKRLKVDGKVLTPTQRAEKFALSVLSEIGDYYEGNVYGFKVIDQKGEEIDSCWGFIGDYDGYVLEEAKLSALSASNEAKEGELFAEKFFHL